MLTLTGSQTLYGQLTDNVNSANTTFGTTMINEGIRIMLGDLPWPFLETTTTALTVAGTQTYTLPANLSRLVNVYIQVGTYKYQPTNVTNFDDWNSLNNPSGVQSDNVSFFFVLGNTIQFWPTPSSSGSTITYEYLQSTKDISVADYTAGTILTATNGSASITGFGTSWNAGMVGKWLRITSDSVANKGDGFWYQISAVGSTTTLTLAAVYAGVSIVAGAAAYTIGDCSLIPEKYQTGPVFFATSEYYRKQDDQPRADRYLQKFEDSMLRMKNEYGTKTTQVVIDDNSDYQVINPNLNKSAT